MGTYTDITKLDTSRNCLRRIARHDEPQFSKNSIVNVMEKFVKTVNVMDDTILVPCRLMDRQVGDSSDILPTVGKDFTSNQHTLEHSSGSRRNAIHSKNVHEFLNSSELFNLYNILNSLKNDLLWTGKDCAAEEEDESKLENLELGNCSAILTRTESDSILKNDTGINTVDGGTTTAGGMTVSNSSAVLVKGHNRRPSTASVASTVSVVSVSNLSDSDSEISNENDSGVEFEGGNGNKSDNPQSSSDASISSSDNMRALKAANMDKATELAKRCKRHLNGLYQCLEQMTEAANYLSARYQSDIGPV